jgi:beta-galactosidase
MKDTLFSVLRRLVFATAAACSFLTLSAGEKPAGQSPTPARITLDFDADWRFSLGEAANAMMPAFDDGAWSLLDVPHDWSSTGPFGPQYGSGNGFAPGGIGWYRKHFTLDAANSGKLVVVEFDGVYDHAEVWINGQFVGGRPYGYSSFHFDLTRYVKFGGDNVIAVRVDHSRYADSRFYTGSGIYRHVRLCLKDRIHIGQWGTFVTTPRVSASAALVHVETTLVNASDEPREITLRSELLSADGRLVTDKTTVDSLAAGESRTVVQELELASPQLWSLETPTRYALRSRVSSAGGVVDETKTDFGIRTLVFDPDKGFFLNGHPLKLKGVCLHHDAGSLGAAVPEKVLERRLRLLRDLGVNAIRTSHNPPAPELLDLCDRLGLLVKDEAFDEFTPAKKKWVQGWNVGEPGKFGYAESFLEWSVRDMEDLVRRDRNHPSVIMWSIGNEIDYSNDPYSHPVLDKAYRPQNPPASDLVRLAKPLIAAVRRFDTSRPVTAALAHVEMSDAVGFGELFDIVGYNYQELRYKDDHRKFPRRFIFGSENQHDYSAWVAVRDTEYISGQFLWTGIDYLGEAVKWPERGSNFGLLDLCGFKKPMAWFRQSLWSDKPMVYVSAALSNETATALQVAPTQGTPLLDQKRRLRSEERWNWPAGSTLSLYCVTNCQEVQLLLNGKVIGSKRLTAAVNGVLNWSLPYEPGSLKALGLNEGKPVCEFTLETAGPAARVELLPDTTTLAADGKDICHLEYRIIDAKGIRVPDATPSVNFEIEGAGEIIGIGNGDLTNSENPRSLSHRAFAGRGLAILQSRKSPGLIKVKASAPGLEPAAVTLTSR